MSIFYVYGLFWVMVLFKCDASVTLLLLDSPCLLIFGSTICLGAMIPCSVHICKNWIIL
ncbi:hypothetical protein F4861DRAFT_286950 [Xylaria intraflava]|nr:hypothetical protein F4861DRAFT_286950 [Xylaria intraflava]